VEETSEKIPSIAEHQLHVNIVSGLSDVIQVPLLPEVSWYLSGAVGLEIGVEMCQMCHCWSMASC